MKLRALAVVLLVSSGSRAWVIVPARTGLQPIADRTHGLVCEVVSRVQVDVDGTPREARTIGTGVLVEGGLALTSLHTVVMQGEDGAVEVADDVQVLIADHAPAAARLVAGDLELDVAVLELVDSPADVPAAQVSSTDPSPGAALVALGAQGTKVTAVMVTIAGVDGTRLQPAAELGMPFWGGPLFDAKGLLAGVGTPKGIVPASVLAEVLARSSESR